MKAMESDAKSYNFLVSQGGGGGGETKIFSFFWLHLILLRPLRREFFMFISENNKNFAALSSENKFIWLLSNEDPVICKKLALFIHKCFEVRSDSNQ
jgi:hypothetical protein